MAKLKLNCRPRNSLSFMITQEVHMSKISPKSGIMDHLPCMLEEAVEGVLCLLEVL